MLKCPNCGGILQKVENQYRCERHHHFDCAKEGYVNLMLHYQKTQGDNQLLVEARTQFLKLDYYAFLKETLIDLIHYFPHQTILDAGCGEGYYTNAFANHFPNVIGIDLSKYAIKRASKNSKAHYLINSIQDIALQNNSVDIITNIFSFRNYAEFHRVLKKEGYLIEVVPYVNHLVELKQVLYDEVKHNEETSYDTQLFEKIDRIIVQDKKQLTQDELQKLFAMTPYYYKTSLEDKKKLEKVTSMIVTFSFVVNIYVRREQ